MVPNYFSFCCDLMLFRVMETYQTNNILKFIMFIICIICGTSCCFCAKILGIFPTPSISHQLPFSLIMKSLHARGHEITTITTDPIKENLTNYNEIDVSFIYKYWSKIDFFATVEDHLEETLDSMLPISEFVSEAEVKSPQVQALINSGQKFDLVILEPLMYQVYYGLLHKVGSPPRINILSLGMWTPSHTSIGNPNNPAYCPDFMLDNSHHMTFWERMNSARHQFEFGRLSENELLDLQERLLRRYFGSEPPPVRETERNVSFFLVNNHWSMNYPRPYLPGVAELTGLHIQETRKPLPKDFETFLSGADDDVIYFSLGSNLNASTMPEEKRRAFLEAFSELPQRVLWKWETGHMEGKPDNVMVSKWVPQQDILAHRRVKLFITQGGLQSMNEASYFGVPMVVIPVFGDQGQNAGKIVEAGIGVRLNFKDVTKDTVLAAVRKVLANPSYRAKMDSLSAVYKYEPSRSRDRAVWWIEYVLRHKGAKHFRSAALDLHWAQYFLLDLLAVTLISIVSIATMVNLLVRRVIYVIKNK